jgi:anaphase-promoting complex subunit 4
MTVYSPLFPSFPNAKLTILENNSHLLNFSINPSPTGKNKDETPSNQFHLEYRSYKSPSNNTPYLPDPLKIALDGKEAGGLVLHSFPLSGSKSRPVRLAVSGRRKERRAVCVLYADQVHYEVLDLDNQAQDEDEAMEE